MYCIQQVCLFGMYCTNVLDFNKHINYTITVMRAECNVFVTIPTLSASILKSTLRWLQSYFVPYKFQAGFSPLFCIVHPIQLPTKPLLKTATLFDKHVPLKMCQQAMPTGYQTQSRHNSKLFIISGYLQSRRELLRALDVIKSHLPMYVTILKYACSV